MQVATQSNFTYKTQTTIHKLTPKPLFPSTKYMIKRRTEADLSQQGEKRLTFSKDAWLELPTKLYCLFERLDGPWPEINSSEIDGVVAYGIFTSPDYLPNIPKEKIVELQASLAPSELLTIEVYCSLKELKSYATALLDIEVTVKANFIALVNRQVQTNKILAQAINRLSPASKDVILGDDNREYKILTGLVLNDLGWHEFNELLVCIIEGDSKQDQIVERMAVLFTLLQSGYTADNDLPHETFRTMETFLSSSALISNARSTYLARSYVMPKSLNDYIDPKSPFSCLNTVIVAYSAKDIYPKKDSRYTANATSATESKLDNNSFSLGDVYDDREEEFDSFEEWLEGYVFKDTDLDNENVDYKKLASEYETTVTRLLTEKTVLFKQVDAARQIESNDRGEMASIDKRLNEIDNTLKITDGTVTEDMKIALYVEQANITRTREEVYTAMLARIAEIKQTQELISEINKALNQIKRPRIPYTNSAMLIAKNKYDRDLRDFQKTKASKNDNNIDNKRITVTSELHQVFHDYCPNRWEQYTQSYANASEYEVLFDEVDKSFTPLYYMELKQDESEMYSKIAYMGIQAHKIQSTVSDVQSVTHYSLSRANVIEKQLYTDSTEIIKINEPLLAKASDHNVFFIKRDLADVFNEHLENPLEVEVYTIASVISFLKSGHHATASNLTNTIKKLLVSMNSNLPSDDATIDKLFSYSTYHGFHAASVRLFTAQLLFESSRGNMNLAIQRRLYPAAPGSVAYVTAMIFLKSLSRAKFFTFIERDVEFSDLVSKYNVWIQKTHLAAPYAMYMYNKNAVEDLLFKSEFNEWMPYIAAMPSIMPTSSLRMSVALQRESDRSASNDIIGPIIAQAFGTGIASAATRSIRDSIDTGSLNIGIKGTRGNAKLLTG